MAKATFVPAPPPILPPPSGVILELSLEEAQAVLLVMGKVIWDPDRSPRGSSNNVYWALEALLGSEHRLPFTSASGNIVFRNTELGDQK
jgi:hypothetical protein